MMHIEGRSSVSLFIVSILILTVFGQHDENGQISSMLSSSKSIRYSSLELAIAKHIQELIHTHPVMLFSKSYCRYSRRAKDILLKYNLGNNYYALEIDLFPSESNVYQDQLQRLTGARTVPRVFINGQFIGGADQIALLDETGDLLRLLQKANALVY